MAGNDLDGVGEFFNKIVDSLEGDEEEDETRFNHTYNRTICFPVGFEEIFDKLKFKKGKRVQNKVSQFVRACTLFGFKMAELIGAEWDDYAKKQTKEFLKIIKNLQAEKS